MKNHMLLILILLLPWQLYSQKVKTDANIIGHVASHGNHIPYANVVVKGSTMGTTTDETGHYQLVNLPIGEVTIAVSAFGFRPQERKMTTLANTTQEVKFDLLEDALNLDEVVVSADRSAQRRSEAPVIVNTISPKLFTSTQSVTLSESLNFSPGLRLENNCQNCGFTQVRMNGMEGPYSQILINSRPIFSGLAGVYGLELIPTNMIERVEVVRGGGSALFGSNAIAGTINIILKDPIINTYEVGTNVALSGVGNDGSAGPSTDYSVNFNTSLVSDDHKTGVSVYGFTRERGMFDANSDSYSEIAPMSNLTLGSRFFHRFSYRSKLAIDFFTIKEQRDGGNKQDLPMHERDVAEAVGHDLKTAAATYEQFFRKYDLLSVYASGQYINRSSYYGANQSLSSYGNSRDKTYNIGAQYKANFDNATLIAGLEHTGSYLVDKKLGYPDYSSAVIVDGELVSIPHTDNTIVADQSSNSYGAFAQYELKLDKMKVVLGGRFDHYAVEDLAKANVEAKTGSVFSPRISWMYELFKNVQARASYSQGYRAPQIFDEDLHIETSGSRQVINVNDPNLKQETSHSYMASLDYNGMIGSVYAGLLLEGFYTRLEDPFVNKIGTPDANGSVLYTRVNAENGANVQGVNMEFKLRPIKMFSLTSGFTIQSSRYDEAQEFNEHRFFRTPNQYGFFAADLDLTKDLCFSATGNYTGSMLVPYFGTQTDTDMGELRKSNDFFDFGLKVKYNVKLNGASIQWFGGVKNLFNSYQSDFDKGVDRDPAYMYGPVSPRTLYIGFRIGNLLD